MRPHLLRVTAFGAFGGTAEVSFDELAGSGLFLLHGETGAGKTTLLDAIGFALYGRVPGERNKTKRLRSDHASAADRTEVTFETTIGRRHLRITRRPQQVRPKAQRRGTTSEPAKILLEEESGGRWHTVSTRAKEADDEIADAMGMSADQFFQVVLLPQGQFAQFLHADADERRKLLQKLFRTGRFRTVEDWLAERRKTTRDQVREAEQALTTLAARIAQVAGVPGPGEEPTAQPGPRPGAQPAEEPAAPASALPGAQPGTLPGEDGAAGPGLTTAWAHELAVVAESSHAANARTAQVARSELDAARTAEARARELADRQGRRAALLARRDEDRRCRLHGVVEHAHGIAEPGRDVEIEHRQSARGLGIAIGHRHQRRFLEAEDVADVVLDREGVHQRQFGGAGIAEHHLDAFLLEQIEEGAFSGHYGQVSLPWSFRFAGFCPRDRNP